MRFCDNPGMKRRFSALVPLLLLFAGCGGGETPAEAPVAEAPKTTVVAPSMEVAAETVASSPEFSEYMFTRAAFSLPMRGDLLKGAAREAAEDLEKAGWILIDPAGNVVLAGKGVGDKRFIPRENGSLDIVPLARKEFVSVDGIGQDDAGDATIDFTWRWIPNEVQQSFTRGSIATRFDGDQKARATIYPKKDGTWGIMRIAEVVEPAPESAATGT